MSSARPRPVSDSFTAIPVRGERRTARDDDNRRRRRSEPIPASHARNMAAGRPSVSHSSPTSRSRFEPIAETHCRTPRNHRHSQSIHSHSPRHRDSGERFTERPPRAEVPLRSILKPSSVSKPTMPPKSYGSAMVDRPPSSTYRNDQTYNYYSPGQRSSPPRDPHRLSQQDYIHANLPHIPIHLPSHSQTHENIYLPAFYHFYPPQPKESLTTRIKNFFIKISTEPELLSPPPTRPVSRTSSYYDGQ